jgi:hypothetical protein
MSGEPSIDALKHRALLALVGDGTKDYWSVHSAALVVLERMSEVHRREAANWLVTQMGWETTKAGLACGVSARLADQASGEGWRWRE